MYKIIYVLLIAFLAMSCDDNNDSPFLFIPDATAQLVEMDVEVGASANLVFTPTLHASLIIAKWGDGSRFEEYVNPDSASTKAPSLQPLRHTFPAAGNYTVYFRATTVRKLDVSRDEVGQPLTFLSLTNCRHLRALSNTGQSLKRVRITTSGLKTVDFTSLSKIEDFSISKCDSLASILLNNNSLLSNISLSDNQFLSATALDALFLNLPQAEPGTRTITLSNNAGDASCDTSIATRKGWTVKVE